ncbi:hypothetical protein B0H11DRAFT_1901412 [Mycena galericulata]|nr:hypothetical protein B0H11DRAFT_1901412 [Mycena galericulata]
MTQVEYWHNGDGSGPGVCATSWHRKNFEVEARVQRSAGNPAIPRVDLDNRLRPKMPVGKPWARRGRFPASGSPGNDRFFKDILRHEGSKELSYSASGRLVQD